MPQGSILGPLLFLIYINDLPNCLQHSKPRMFADDTNITTTGTSLKEMVEFANIDLENIHGWLQANKLSLNVTKTEYMFIGSDNNLAKVRNISLIFLNGQPIKRVNIAKSLGLLIDERLSWSNHIAAASKKISSAIAGLRQVKSFVPINIAITIYNSLVKPLFDYCDIVLDNMSGTNATRLQKLQNRAARVITGKGYDVRSSELRSQLKWKPLYECRREHILIMMYKVLNNMAPSYLRDHFEISGVNEMYSLRKGKLCLVLPKAQTDYLKKSFAFSGAKMWNDLPEEVKCSININEFKARLASLPLT